MLAVCDASLIGKTITEGDLSISVHHDFYGTQMCDEHKLEPLVEKATIINAIGESIITYLKKKKYIEESGIRWISGVPHAQIITIV